MPMSTAYLDAIAEHGRTIITHIGLVDESGTEISGGSYARQAVTWTTASNGRIQLQSDLTFDVPAGATVAGWRGYSAASGGTDYGGADLPSQPFATEGTYTLRSDLTWIDHIAE